MQQQLVVNVTRTETRQVVCEVPVGVETVNQNGSVYIVDPKQVTAYRTLLSPEVALSRGLLEVVSDPFSRG